MSSEKFYLTGAWQGERLTRKEIKKLVEESRLSEIYKFAVLLEIDFGEKKISRKMSVPSEEMDYTLEGYSVVFTVPTRQENKLFTPSHATIFEIDLEKFDVISRDSNPLYNDVHHLHIEDGKKYVVSTGIDRVIVHEGDETKIFPSISEAKPLVDGVDYRNVNTKPHLSHPNYVSPWKDEVWVTRAHQHDVVCLNDLENPIPLSDVMVHDGFVKDGLKYFTSVKGEVIVVDPEKKEIVEKVDLVTGRWHLLTGWCRGVLVTDEFYYVGFSVFRRTKQYENLQWIKSKLTGQAAPLPTRIEKIDRKTGEMVDQFTFEPEDLSAIFWFDFV